MVEFPLSQYVNLYLRLSVFQKIFKERELTEDETPDFLTWIARMEEAGRMCEIDLSYFTSRIVEKVDRPDTITTTLNELLSQLRAGWDNELRKRLFMFIPMVDATFLNKEAMFGPEVAEKISEANTDIQSAGNCYGTGNYTASVFHLMRVAEFGLRRIGRKLKVSLRHKRKPITIEYAVWDQVITACNNKIGKIRQGRVGKKRERLLSLYSDAAQHCLFMKDIWRNNISHTRQPYNQPEALAVMARVKDFMRFLALMPD